MITLYIKTHRLTGLKYFGKTIQDDPISYQGSGTYWLRHIKKHGYDVDTEIYLQSENVDYVTQEALRFSRVYDIVNSSLWANLQEENGTDGHPPGTTLSQEHRKKISEGNKGRVLSYESRKKISESSKKKIFTEEHRRNISKSNSKKRRPHTEETKRKIGIKSKGQVMSPEAREKISKANTGLKRDPFTKEHRGKMSKAKSTVQWIVANINGDLQVITNLSKFCDKNGLNSGCMENIGTGRQKIHKGWWCKKVVEYEKMLYNCGAENENLRSSVLTCDLCASDYEYPRIRTITP